jgi:[CysO sulfur-carrier protein]-S-L-cysteine hydrolase
LTLATVAVYAARGEAEIAAASLRSAGIEALVVADDEGGLNPGFYRTYGVRVLVAEAEAAAAGELLGIEELVVHEEMIEAMRQHARFCAPEEACGLIAVDAAGRPRMVYCLTNDEHSARRFTVSPSEHFGAMRHAERHGWEIGGVFHSHPSGQAAPSPTDIEHAPDRTWWYLVVGFDGTLGSFRIDGAAAEVATRVVGILAADGRA